MAFVAQVQDPKEASIKVCGNIVVNHWNRKTFKVGRFKVLYDVAVLGTYHHGPRLL
jgi:hypothetical protein